MKERTKASAKGNEQISADRGETPASSQDGPTKPPEKAVPKGKSTKLPFPFEDAGPMMEAFATNNPYFFGGIVEQLCEASLRDGEIDETTLLFIPARR